jgi:hypothetical protein
MYADYLSEMTPAGQIVWKWRTWEHLDPGEDGFTEVQAIRTLWALGNSARNRVDRKSQRYRTGPGVAIEYSISSWVMIA